MRWSEEHDLAFVREILLFEPFKYPNGSSERGQAWQFVADSLNQMEHPTFSISQRSVRDRFRVIIDKHKRKMREEGAASGISSEETELDIALQDILARISVSEESFNQKKNRTKLAKF